MTALASFDLEVPEVPAALDFLRRPYLDPRRFSLARVLKLFRNSNNYELWAL